MGQIPRSTERISSFHIKLICANSPENWMHQTAHLSRRRG